VSTATVSRALSAPHKVSAITRERVAQAVISTGYTLNQAARSLRQKTAKTILVGLPDIRNPFFSTILDSIEREATNRGYGVLVANLHLGAEPALRLQEYLLSNRADGLLLLDGSLDAEQLRRITKGPQAIPLVMACEDIPASGFDAVVTDNVEAAYRATQHLIELGHKKIGHILGPIENNLARDRLAGFQQAVDEAGLEVPREWIFHGNFGIEGGYAAAARFRTLKTRPTGIFAANDESAIGFLSGMRRHGLRCPEDISVVGFDDLAVAAHYMPPLTTVHQPRAALGQLAAAALIDMLEDGQSDGPALRIVLNSALVIRQSTGEPPHDA
jgi:LacI family repressor for deo operon, udp, cdd, tsx, nupC, and nupG